MITNLNFKTIKVLKIFIYEILFLFYLKIFNFTNKIVLY